MAAVDKHDSMRLPYAKLTHATVCILPTQVRCLEQLLGRAAPPKEAGGTKEGSAESGSRRRSLSPKGPSGNRRASRMSAEAADKDSQAKAEANTLTLPAGTAGGHLRRARARQLQGRGAEALAQLEAGLGNLPKPQVQHPAAAVGGLPPPAPSAASAVPAALLLLWRARTKRAQHLPPDQVLSELRLALQHCGYPDEQPPAVAEEPYGADALASRRLAERGEGAMYGAESVRWWVCGLLCEEALLLEASGDAAAAVSLYQHVLERDAQHLTANANLARLLPLVEQDLLGAAVACVRVAEGAHKARSAAVDAVRSAGAEDDDNEKLILQLEVSEVGAWRLVRELESLRALLEQGFVRAGPAEATTRDVAITRQQGNIAVEIHAERQRMRREQDEEANESNLARRRRLHEAWKAQGALLSTLAHAPEKLYEALDGRLTTLMWGMERSAYFLNHTYAEQEDDGVAQARVSLGIGREGSTVVGHERGGVCAEGAKHELSSDDDSDDVPFTFEPRRRPAKDPNDEVVLDTPTADRLVAAAKLLRV